MQRSCEVTLEPFTSLPCGRHEGWLDQPNHRGTFDILWTCLVTTFISTYTILCLNVPAPKDRHALVIGRRLKWMLLGIVGPEIVLTYAAGQWSRAKHSVKEFQKEGYPNWTIRQAFFTDMGGFVLHARNSKPFPLNAKHLQWLVVNGHVDYPNISEEEIWDKSKQDTLGKVITAFQMAYLIIQAIGRAAQHLPITLLELNALAIVVCSILTSLCWLRKPLDVNKSIPIYSDSTIEEITENRPWFRTPLDFVDENGPGWSMNLQPFMKMPVIPSDRPIQRIPNDRFPMNPYGPQEYYLCFATLVFTAVHVAGWNYSFPSNVEKIFWRVSSLVLFGVTAAFWIFETMASWVRLGRWKRIIFFLRENRESTIEEPTSEEVEKPSANVTTNTTIDSAQEDEEAHIESCDIASGPSRQETKTFVPTVLPLLWEFCAITPLAIIFAIARGFTLVEGFMELRSLPAEAFRSVDWSLYLPHY